MIPAESRYAMSHFLPISTYQVSSARLRAMHSGMISFSTPLMHFLDIWDQKKIMIYTSMGGRMRMKMPHFWKAFPREEERGDEAGESNKVTSAVKVWEEFEVFARSTTPNAKSDFYMEVALLQLQISTVSSTSSVWPARYKMPSFYLRRSTLINGSIVSSSFWEYRVVCRSI